MMDKRDPVSADISSESLPGSRVGVSRPTLFNLLEVLASDSITTPQQRHSIREIVTEFLANKFEHSKVYSYIGAVVGHDRLHSVIKQLEADPDRAPLPDQNGLVRIENAFNLSRSYKSFGPGGATTSGSARSQDFGGTSTGVGGAAGLGGGAGGSTSPGGPLAGPDQGFNTNTKEEILRSIRKNLNAKRAPQQHSTGLVKGLASVRAASAGILLQKACWLPVRKCLTAGALYGHSLICIGSRAYMLGGSNGRMHGSNFARAHVVSLVDFSSRQVSFVGEVPSFRQGNSASVALVQQSHVIIIFGGFNGERFFNDVYVLDLEKRKWIRRLTAGRAPAPRDEHSALVYPARCESTQRPRAGAEYLFVFGGKTGLKSQLQCLNDMWAYHIETGTWSVVEMTGQERPRPRFGVCALWADDDTICIFGGETCGPSGLVDRSERVLLDDLWMFKLGGGHASGSCANNNNNNGVGVNNGTLDGGGLNSFDGLSRPSHLQDLHQNSAHLGAVVHTGEWIREVYEGNIGPRSHYSAIFIAQRCKELHTGVPRTIERLMLLTGGLTYAPGSKRSLVASDKLYFYFFSQRRWYMLKPNYPRNFVGEPFEPRQLHVACFFEKRNILFPSSRPSVPCIFFHGGFHRKQVLSDAWVLSLTGEELFLRNSVVAPDVKSCNAVELRQRAYSPWYYRESHSPDVLWALSSVQRWAFGAIAHLVANSVKEQVNATRCCINWEQSPLGDEYMLSIQDDGNGLDYGAMNRLLKLFGQSKTAEPSAPFEYGCGFKMAFGRTASSCVVMSRTHDSIGIGMLSMELMGQCESREMAAPLCMWRLPSKELINKEGSRMVDQRHHQRLLITYSPFTSATLLAQQINVLGTSPGTRVVFWNLKQDLDSVAFSRKHDTLVLETVYDKVANGSLGGTPGCSGGVFGNDTAGTSLGNDNDVEMDGNGSSGGNGDGNGSSGRDRNGGGNEQAFGGNANATVASPDEKAAGVGATTAAAKGVDSPVEIDTSWKARFPCWTAPQFSIDYCLSTYLYWLFLSTSCTISVCNFQLVPEALKGDFNHQMDLDTIGGGVAAPGSSSLSEGGGAASTLAGAASGTATATSSCAPTADSTVNATTATTSTSTSTTTANAAPAASESAGTSNGNLPLQSSGTSTVSTAGTTAATTTSIGTTNTNSQLQPPAQAQHSLPQPHQQQERQEEEYPADVEMKSQKNTIDSTSNYNCRRMTCQFCSLTPIGANLGCLVYLKRRLHCLVQLPYLFSPKDHGFGAFAVLGFLNFPEGADEASRAELDDGVRVAEAGILLYYKNRLITRLEGHFPAPGPDLQSAVEPPTADLFEGNVYRFCCTGIISVPEWLLPCVNKQEFVHENNAVYFDFKSRLVSLVSDYLKLCLDTGRRSEWEQVRTEALRRFDEVEAAQYATKESEDETTPPLGGGVAVGIMENDQHAAPPIVADAAVNGSNANLAGATNANEDAVNQVEEHVGEELIEEEELEEEEDDEPI